MPTYFIIDCEVLSPYVPDAITLGYTVEGVPLVLTAHSLKVLHLNLRGFLAYRPYCLERLIHRGFRFFLTLYVYYISWGLICQPPFLLFLFKPTIVDYKM